MKTAKGWYPSKVYLPRTKAQIMAHKENYQMYQLTSMKGHLEMLKYVDHRNSTIYTKLIQEVNDLLVVIKLRQSCRMNPNQSKCPSSIEEN